MSKRCIRIVGRWHWPGLLLGLGDSTSGHLLDSLFLLASFVHSVKLFLLRALLSLRSCGIWLLHSAHWLTFNVWSKGTLLGLLLELIVLLGLICLIELPLAHIVEALIRWGSLDSTHFFHRSLSCDHDGCECALFELTLIFRLFCLFVPV